nr:MAG TPA: Large Terminase [Caudoviricetes sp.]
MERELVVPSGPFAGSPFVATPQQALFLLWYYAVDKQGRWVFSRAVRRLAKGSGKTPFAAAMALAELLGPVRFGGFVHGVPGGCVGVPVRLPLVQVAATSEEQTGVTMRIVTGMAHKGSRLQRKYQLDPGKTFIDTPSGGRLRLLTSSAASAEGSESSFVIADEVEHWKPANGGVELWHTLRRNLAKTGSRMLETCNAWEPGVDSVAEASFDDWVAQEEGRLRDGAGRTLYDARVAPSFTSLSDEPGEGEVSLTEGLKFVYEGSPWTDIEAIKSEVWSPSNPVSVSRRFYLNQPTVSESAWVEPGVWAALADPGRKLRKGEEVVLFFDGSKSGDNTALVGCCMSDGFVFTVDVWEPEEDTGLVDVDDVVSAVDWVRAQFDVVGFFSDVREWESFAKLQWPRDFEESIVVPAQDHGKAASLVAWDMRSHGLEFATAAEMCRAEIEDGLFHHDGNFVTARHVANCRMAEQRGHITVKKESPKSSKKIDAAVCVIGARMVYRMVKEDPRYKKRLRAGGEWIVG